MLYVQGEMHLSNIQERAESLPKVGASSTALSSLRPPSWTASCPSSSDCLLHTYAFARLMLTQWVLKLFGNMEHALRH